MMLGRKTSTRPNLASLISCWTCSFMMSSFKRLIESCHQKYRRARRLTYAKGIKIGRKKTRPSELIRRLRSKGLVYREIARIAGCSQGAVNAELKAWRKEKELGIDKPLQADIPIDLPPIPTKKKDEEKSPAPMEAVSYTHLTLPTICSV